MLNVPLRVGDSEVGVMRRVGEEEDRERRCVRTSSKLARSSSGRDIVMFEVELVIEWFVDQGIFEK